MCIHENKDCPRCQSPFRCMPGNIIQCPCYDIRLNLEERSFIEERYADCLCLACLLELKQRYLFFKEKYFFNAGR
jgi:hypothetical protein